MPVITIPLVTVPTPFTTIGRYDNALSGQTGQNNGQDIFQVFDTRGQIITHMNSDGSIDPPLFPLNFTTNFSSAQLLNLHTTPVVISVPPQTVTTAIIIPQVVTMVYFAGSTPYTVTGGDGFLYVGWGNNPTVDSVMNDFSGAGFFDQTTSQIQVGSGDFAEPSPLASVIGQPVTLGIKDTLTLGNGTLSLTMSYQTISTQ